MDFFRVVTKDRKDGIREFFPDFIVGRSKDLMIRGRAFYAIWDAAKSLWSTDEYDVQRLVDDVLYSASQEHEQLGGKSHIKLMHSSSSGSWRVFRRFVQDISDHYHPLDTKLTFQNDEVLKSDYVSRKLPYALEAGDHSAWDELTDVLYSPEEKAKIEWAIGSIVAGDSKKIQKFLVLYGPAGTGKSTILNIIQSLFQGYTTTFEAKALGSNNGTFATEVFKNNPLVAIQHDGDLSRIEDNTRLNSIVSHEEMTMNEKFKSSYTARVNAFLFMGTNQPVKISDAKSGIIRRLIDVHPTGVKIPTNHYNTLMHKIEFELGAIAHHCQDVYLTMGKNYYNNYRPLEMMLQTDVFYNFIETNYDIFEQQDGTSLTQAYSLYKEYCLHTGIEKPRPQYKIREELRNYFDEFHDRYRLNGDQIRSYYKGFNANKFKIPNKDEPGFSLALDETESIFDDQMSGQPAQESKIGPSGSEIPKHRWTSVKTTLAEIDTHEVHYVKVPENHIVIDFDLKDENGNKSAELNLAAASEWPPTYGEFSKGGNGVHLHYVWNGDTKLLAGNYSDGIEVKTFHDNASLRRRLTHCNSVPIATINSGLPLKEKKMLPTNVIQSERGLRELIARNLRKEIHPGTKPSLDFIHKILDEAYSSGLSYNITDMRPKIMAFANNSTNQQMASLKIVQQMKFQSDEKLERTFVSDDGKIVATMPADTRNVMFDVEVYPNLFVVCWGYEDSDTIITMINPSSAEIEKLLEMRLIGFNNRRYDNHILYAAFMGYNNRQLFELSQKIISGEKNAMFGEAYNLSYTDINDFSSKKQSLKMFEIELGLEHMELDIPWEEDVPEELISKVVAYCSNDVIATKAVFKDRAADFKARQILAELSGLTVNDSTAKLTEKIVFGNDRHHKDQFVYTDLSELFPGYEFDMGKSSYLDEDPSEGGYVYAEPGMYDNVAVLDVASMHPRSIIELNLFGKHTKNYAELLEARLAIKHRDYNLARNELLGGRLAPFLESDEDAAELAYALKIVINIVYGLTSAKFDNPFRDIRNKDNIVAKRGALFMIDLKRFVQKLGYQVVHIKTDSIKIPNCDEYIIAEIQKFGQNYGYTFEHEVTYKKFCLVNDAVYIARKDQEWDNQWDAVGAQFQHPVVFKTLFSRELVEFDDLCETKQVKQGVMYLDFEYDRPMVLPKEAMRFVGKTGRFVPIIEDMGGGVLWRIKDDKHYAVTGTKGFYWLEANVVKDSDHSMIDQSYYSHLVEEAKKTISKFGDFESFVN